MEKETIPAISGYLVNSIPDTETPRFVGYGNLPNTVPENHGLFLGVSIASIPDINLPAFQLSFGDKFASSTGDLTFICANYSPSDPEQSLSNLVCLDETTFQSFFSQTGSEPPQPNEWCVISFAEFVANNPTLPITKGNSFENLTAFQTACSVCIQHLIRMKASKNTNYNRIFFIPETTEEENGGEDEESNAADGLGEDEGDNSIDEEGNEDDAVVEAPPSKRTRRPRNSNTEPGERSSPRLSREDYHDPFQNPFQMPPAPNTRGGKVGGARGGRGRGRGAGGKGRGAGSVQKNKKTATPAIVPPVKKTKATDSNTPAKAISVAVGSKTGDFTTPVTYQKQAQGSSDGQFTTIIGQQKETLGYNGQILDQALTFAERWFNRGKTPNSGVEVTEAKVVEAIPKSLEGDILQFAGSKKPDTDIDFAHAWEVLNDESSWKIATDKESTLVQDFGISSSEQLSYLDTDDIKELASKLKKVPARMLSSCYNLNL